MEQTLSDETINNDMTVDNDINDSNNQKYWDPVFSELAAEKIRSFERADNELIKKFRYYQQYPKRITNIMLLLFLLALVSFVFFLYVLSIGVNNGTIRTEDDISGCEIILFPIILPIFYYSKIKLLEKQLAYLLIAEEYGWLYSPNHLDGQWGLLAKSYPEVFKKGDDGQILLNQFWGVYDRAPFWMAQFHYTVGNGRTAENHTETIYMFRLPRKAACDFMLKPQSLLTKLQSGFTTESNDFNKLFHIAYNGDPQSVGADILETLTPDAQEKLIEARKVAGSFNLLFRGNIMVVSFERELKPHYTNFFNKVALDPRDTESISQKMNAIVSLGDAILSCME
jgi:hypothetical protein